MKAPGLRTADEPQSPTGGSPGGSAPPRTPLYDRRFWRQVCHLLLNLPLGVAGFAFTAVLLSAGVGLAVTAVGLPLLAAGLAGCRGFGSVARRRARWALELEVPAPAAPVRRPGAAGAVIARLTDGYAWRCALYCVLLLPWGVVGFALTLLLLVAGWPVLPWVVRWAVALDRALVGGLLGAGGLSERVRELEDDRSAVVDAAAADLRRIERDLHDGAQARLVALAMDLGLAREKLAEDPSAGGDVAHLVGTAHDEVKLALQELRDLARGIHPAVLTDRGLDAALSAVASRCTVPDGVRVTVDLAGRPHPAVEGIAYFTVSELLANVSKHAGAAGASVDVRRAGDRLVLLVRDDGRGGAVASPGGGLAGLAERVGAVDGVLAVDSPAGGPTTVSVELPWRARA